MRFVCVYGKYTILLRRWQYESPFFEAAFLPVGLTPVPQPMPGLSQSWSERRLSALERSGRVYRGQSERIRYSAWSRYGSPEFILSLSKGSKPTRPALSLKMGKPCSRCCLALADDQPRFPWLSQTVTGQSVIVAWFADQVKIARLAVDL